jgi:hypothetical protein
MRVDEQADICQSEDGEGILVDPVHALPNLKALPPSCFVPLPQRSRPGLGWVGLQAIFVVYSSPWYDQLHTGTTMFVRKVGYFCVRSFRSSLDSRADVEAQALYPKYEIRLEKFRGSFGGESTTIRNADREVVGATTLRLFGVVVISSEMAVARPESETRRQAEK